MIDGKESRIREALDRFKYGPGSNKMIYAGIVVTMLLFAGIIDCAFLSTASLS